MPRGRQKGQVVEKKKVTYVTIGDNYRFSMDNSQMALENKAGNQQKPIGYYTQFEPMIKRIIKLEVLNKTADKTIDIKEFLDVMIDERKRIEKLFEKVK